MFRRNAFHFGIGELEMAVRRGVMLIVMSCVKSLKYSVPGFARISFVKLKKGRVLTLSVCGFRSLSSSSC